MEKVKQTKKVEEDKKVSSNLEILEKVAEETSKNPRLSVWSLDGFTVLKYLRETIPKFSISEEAKNILDDGVKNKYPELWKELKKLKVGSKK